VLQVLASLLIVGLVLYAFFMFIFGPARCPKGYTYDREEAEYVNNCAHILNDSERAACYRSNP
jgi:hypothetical protein